MKKKIFKNTESVFFEKAQGPVTLIPIHQWVVLLAFGVSLFVLLLWSIFGTVYTRVHGMGVLVPGGNHIYPISSKFSGIIQAYLVKRGDNVKKGDIIARISTLQIDKKITNQKKYLSELEREHKKIVNSVEKQEDALTTYQNKLLSSLSQKATFTTEYKNYLSNFLKGVKKINEKGYVSLTKYESYKDQYYNTVNILDQTLMNMSKAQYSQEEQRYQMYIKVVASKLKLIQEYNNLSVLQLERFDKRNIIAHKTGTVISIMGTIGQYIDAGQPLANIVPEQGKPKLFVLFKPFEGKRIKKGMSALSSPTYIDKYQYGSIKGQIENIEDYPSDENAILAVILDKSWLKQLGFSGDAMLMSTVTLDTNDKTFTGYQWTSSSGPPYPITPGSFIDVMVNVKEQAPITLVIPLLRRLMGVQA